MQPAPPAALQLAQRLRQLRQRWPDRLTQDKLAVAFSAEENLAPATVSSWESLKSPKLPPRHRLQAYARFFATPRSVAGGTDTDSDRPTHPGRETGIRETRDGTAPAQECGQRGITREEPTFSRSWHFPDAGLVTFVCAQLPDDQIGPFGDPSDPNYTELQTYADIDALMELHGHIRAENPGPLPCTSGLLPT